VKRGISSGSVTSPPYLQIFDILWTIWLRHLQGEVKPVSFRGSWKTGVSAGLLAVLLTSSPWPARSAGLGAGLGGTLGGLGGAVGGAGGAIGGTVAGPLGSNLAVMSGLPNSTNVDQTLAGVNIPSVDGIARDAVGRPARPSSTDASLIERDASGLPIVGAEIVAIAPTDRDLASAMSMGLVVVTQETMDSLGLSVAILRVPAGQSAAHALAALRTADPSGTFDVDHLYSPSGNEQAVANADPEIRVVAERPRDVGMLDGGVDLFHRAFAHSFVVTTNVSGSAKSPATIHGTAVASLLVGEDGNFHGSVTGAKLFAADVYGGQPNGGSAVAIVRGLEWLSEKGVGVVNASLSGPPNALLAAAVKAFLAGGHILVAAVGNQGPAAPMAYPAAYPGVVGVTSVDETLNIQPDAGRGDVSFAARGVDVRAASLGGNYGVFTGTSFAAPVVAGRLADLLPAPRPDADSMTTELARTAKHLGQLGRDPVFGYGYLAPQGLPSTASR
jgi:hypothetical protein